MPIIIGTLYKIPKIVNVFQRFTVRVNQVGLLINGKLLLFRKNLIIFHLLELCAVKATVTQERITCNPRHRGDRFHLCSDCIVMTAD